MPDRPITTEKVDSDQWAFVALNGDVQIGWCRKAQTGWFVIDMDEKQLAGPFPNRKQAEEVGKHVLADQAGDSNPGW